MEYHAKILRPEQIENEKYDPKPDRLLREPEEIIAEIAALDAESAEILKGIRGML